MDEKKDIQKAEDTQKDKFEEAKDNIEKSKIAYEKLLSDSLSGKGDIHDIFKANQHLSNLNKNSSNQKAYIYDPMQFMMGMGYNEKPLQVDFDVLRTMSHTPVVRYIINLICDLVSAFDHPQDDVYSTGFTIKPKGINGNNKEINAIQKEEIKYLTNFLLNCGDNENHYKGDDFNRFLRKIVQDSLTIDQACFEIVWNKFGYGHPKGRPTKFLAVDGATIRYSNNLDSKGIEDESKAPYVQLYNGSVSAEFYAHEMCFGVRNITTDVRRNGYGRSELEDMLFEVTAFVWAEEYNRNFFKNGSTPKGLMVAKGEVGEERLKEFRNEWQAMTQGVSNSHKVPFIQADSFEWIDMMKANREMEFKQWIELLIQMICAAYRVDPALIGFPSLGEKSGGIKSDNMKERIESSKDRFLYPLLKFLSTQINNYLIYPISKTLSTEYEFTFAGLDGVTKESELKQRGEELKVHATFNEIRKAYGKDPIPAGDVIGNPVFMDSIKVNLEGSESSNGFIDQEEAKKQEEELLKKEKEQLEDIEKGIYDFMKK